MSLLSSHSFVLLALFFLECSCLPPDSSSPESQHHPHLRQHHHNNHKNHLHQHSNSFLAMEENFRLLQRRLEIAVPDRESHIGNMSWLTMMCMYFWNVARSSKIHNICEVGFGQGHSATLFLTANANATLVTFDLFPATDNEISPRAEMGPLRKVMPLLQTAGRQFIESTFPGRHTAVVGDSAISIPQFAANTTLKCDLIFIDGSHKFQPTLTDIINFKALANHDAIVLLDDMENTEVNRAITTAIQRNILLQPFECLEGEVTINREFGPSEKNWVKLDPPKKYCRTSYA